jgi:hypothetical protein
VTPIAIHTTFMRHPIGTLKPHRIRGGGLWRLDPPEYYGQGEAGQPWRKLFCGQACWQRERFTLQLWRRPGAAEGGGERARQARLRRRPNVLPLSVALIAALAWPLTPNSLVQQVCSPKLAACGCGLPSLPAVPAGQEGALGRLASSGEFAFKAVAYGGEGEVEAFVAAQVMGLFVLCVLWCLVDGR